MIKTKTIFSNAYGQSATVQETLIDDLQSIWGQKAIYYSEADGTKVVKLQLGTQGRLQYSVFNKQTRVWSNPILLTPDIPYQSSGEKNQPGGYAGLDTNTQISLEQVPLQKFCNVYTGTFDQMTNPLFYSTVPKIGNIFVPIDHWQSFVLQSSNFQQQSNWVALNREQPVNMTQITEIANGSWFVYASINYHLQMSQPQQIIIYDQFESSPSALLVYQQQTGSFILSPGTYKVEIQVTLYYQTSTNYPLQYQAILQNSGLLISSQRECDTVVNFNQRSNNYSFFVIKLNNTDTMQIQIQSEMYQSVKMICPGTNVFIKKLN